MLKAQKRLTKREIKEDKFVTLYFQIQSFLKQHSREIFYGLGAVIVLWVAGYIWGQKGQEKEQEAVVELTKAQLTYSESNYAAAIPILTNLVDEYDGTDSAIQGIFLLANSHFFEQNYAEASRYFEQYLSEGKDGVLLSSAAAGIAACLEQQESYLDAAKKYEEAAGKYEQSFMVPEQLYHAARCYAAAGESKQAERLLQEIVSKYETSSFKSDAELLMAELAS